MPGFNIDFDPRPQPPAPGPIQMIEQLIAALDARIKTLEAKPAVPDLTARVTALETWAHSGASA